MNLKLKKDYKTTDLLTCSVLIYFDHILVNIDKTNPSRCKFVVKKMTNTDRVLEDFHKEDLRVEPKKFNSIQRTIKSRLYND